MQLAQQRRSFILETVRREGAVRVTELVEQLAVSDMTVRRDLDALAARGLVEKVYGGAVRAPEARGEEPGFDAKTPLATAAKAAIAETAATLVEPGSTVAVSAGTTACAVAARLLDVPRLTLLTNSLPVAELVRAASRERGEAAVPSLLLTGGSPTPSAALVGPLADMVISTLHVDLLILGVHGASEEAGLSTPNLAEAQTNRALIGAARRIAVVADHSKWGTVALSSFAPLDRVDCFVTDAGLPEPAREVLAATVGELLIAGAE
ncbi:DeoR/GlpR family DNA-binding transcription regulator [Streptomyces sp. NBC_00536]|uniref:DeoR/GlpR family DNA-binding transcription regulator n=1 Tax=Streptomyces sp. NBC_00536 TaxID=2975769 RepID=UPI002E810ACC|nr:DeoR/GlpR family DNA-binding transcription regulator [Streptomyces sp. NBC_00536]WUC77073.1 DeoR/GlpR family DNA-binding transcription regulator [Streptomyces sp. NBC_00536]